MVDWTFELNWFYKLLLSKHSQTWSTKWVRRTELQNVFRHLVREVKEADSKSAGLCPRRFESCRCRYFSFSQLSYLSWNGSMAEWSKALDSSSSLFGGVGSNPTWTTFFIHFLTLFCIHLGGRPYYKSQKLFSVRHPGVEPGSQRWERWMITATPMALCLISDFKFSNPFLSIVCELDRKRISNFVWEDSCF